MRAKCLGIRICRQICTEASFWQSGRVDGVSATFLGYLLSPHWIFLPLPFLFPLFPSPPLPELFSLFLPWLLSPFPPSPPHLIFHQVHRAALVEDGPLPALKFISLLLRGAAPMPGEYFRTCSGLRQAKPEQKNKKNKKNKTLPDGPSWCPTLIQLTMANGPGSWRTDSALYIREGRDRMGQMFLEKKEKEKEKEKREEKGWLVFPGFSVPDSIFSAYWGLGSFSALESHLSTILRSF